jgi:hypothetical protein
LLAAFLLILFSFVIPESADRSAERQRREQREKELAGVWVTTDRRVVAGCEPLGGVSISDDNDLDLIRRTAAGRGADVVRVQSVTNDHIAAEMFRCADWDPSNLPTPTPTPTEQRILRDLEMARMKSRILVTRDPQLVVECEKRGEGVTDSRDGGEDFLRGYAVGSRSNVLLLRPVQDPRLFGVYYWCSSKQLEAIAASATPSPTSTRAPTPAP